MSKCVAIHQPNFLPWLGFINKIARADVFVVMDNAQMQKTGGSWTNRAQIVISGQAGWLTAPIVRSFHGVKSIKEIQFNESSDWRQKALRTVQMSYGRAPFYRVIFPFVETLLTNSTSHLAEYNLFAIQSLMERLHLNTNKLVVGSSLNLNGESATDLLIAMTKAVGGTTYLSGGGAGGYQEDDKFSAAGVKLIYQNFRHPTYPQFNTKQFIPGLSVIDALMNCGFEKTAEMLQSDKT